MIERKVILSFALGTLLLGCNGQDTLKEIGNDAQALIIGDKTVTDGIEGNISEDIDALLRVHNQARAEVGVDVDLKWSDTIAKDAQSYADEMAATGFWGHDTQRNQNDGYGNGNYGENLYTSFNTKATLEEAAKAWVDEKQYYTYGEVVGSGDDPTCQDGLDAYGNQILCGHYTQVIWKDTTLVGCGTSRYTTGDRDGWDIVVCKYQTPGNVVGETPY